MAKIKCKYCGEYIIDTDENCSHCGAVNDQHTRVVKETPTTIEELKSWYKARNLPPEETTRFFIGKNIKSARAFGIYQDDSGNFIVYKNKSNGERAIRYKGTDEAYAVNELYLRLKEEILNQKNKNITKRQTTRPSHTYSKPTEKRSSSVRSKRYRKGMPVILPIFCFIFILFQIFNSLSFFDFGAWFNYDPINYAYYLAADNVYYYDGNLIDEDKYVWWELDADTLEWSQSEIFNESTYLEGVTEESEVDRPYIKLVDMLECEWENIDITKSHAYIDAGHYIKPSTGYYNHNDSFYYYLDDTYSSYGSTDNSGWYKYDVSTNDWSYYGSYDDKTLFDDEMWYDPSDNIIGDETGIYEWNTDYYDWTPTNFSDTSWYKSYQDNADSYQDYIDKQDDYDYDDDDDYDWDYDSDYDWDDDYDWDSDWDTDWDSDW